MILGIDPSTLQETLSAGARYFVKGKEVEPLSYLHDQNDIDLMRIRLWVDPYDEQGRPYGGGTVDLDKYLDLAKKGLEKGYHILLDFHFSDFWCDPAKQPTPKRWRGLDYEGLCNALGEYVRDVLLKLKKEGVDLYAIQIGNEITNGMLWPIGKLTEREGNPVRDGYDNLGGLLKVAAASVKRVYPDSKTLIHLERSYDQKVYREFFDEMVAHDVPFDVIGMSYYPYWHGSFEALFANVEQLKARYHRPIWIVETSYGFTEESAYPSQAKPLDNDTFLGNSGVNKPYPLTQDGQAEFLSELIKQSEEHGVEAIVYWEPLWLPMPGLTWAAEEGQSYINEHRDPHNEWANQCLFDYEGEATKGLFAFSKTKDFE